MTLNEKLHSRLPAALHMVVLVLSLGLIVFISIDTFTGRAFLDNPVYMHFQFWVCMVFMADYCINVYLSPKPSRYALRYILFLLVSIPYLNIVEWCGLKIDPQLLYYIRYVPLIRAGVAVAIVISFVSKNRIVGLFATYTTIMVLVVYFSSLIFLQREGPVNPQINDYWTSLWWCCLECTTIGAPINPMTPTGKILAFVLSAMGMIMFPLFTVYLTSIVTKYFKNTKLATAAEKK